MSESDSTPENARVSRRTLVRLLVGLGIGIPVLIELATFLGLVEQSLLGGGGDDADGGGEGTAAHDASRSVGPGDELLPDTAPSETLSAASVRTTPDAWVFDATVEVTNDADGDYVLQLTAVTTDGGSTVEGEGATVRVPAGETATATGQWALPPGERPATMTVVTSLGGAPARTHEVALGRIPVQGN